MGDFDDAADRSAYEKAQREQALSKSGADAKKKSEEQERRLNKELEKEELNRQVKRQESEKKTLFDELLQRNAPSYKPPGGRPETPKEVEKRVKSHYDEQEKQAKAQAISVKDDELKKVSEQNIDRNAQVEQKLQKERESVEVMKQQKQQDRQATRAPGAQGDIGVSRKGREL